MLETALSYIRDARSGYANADPYVKRLWNRTLIERIEIKGGQLAGVALKQPFAGLFLLASSNKGTLVGAPGFEPGLSWSQTKRVTRLRYAPRAGLYRDPWTASAFDASERRAGYSCLYVA